MVSGAGLAKDKGMAFWYSWWMGFCISLLLGVVEGRG